MSNLSTFWVCDIIYGRNTVLAYWSKVLHCLGGSIFTNAAPSKTFISDEDRTLSGLKQERILLGNHLSSGMKCTIELRDYSHSSVGKSAEVCF